MNTTFLIQEFNTLFNAYTVPLLTVKLSLT